MPSGAFLIEAENAHVTERVRRLLRIAEIKIVPARGRRLKTESAFLLGATGFFVLASLLPANNTIFYKIHVALESVVSALQ